MQSVLCLFLLASAVAPATEPATAIPATTTVNVLVTDRQGKPLPSARVIVNGSEHAGVTNKAGRVVFTNMNSGEYTLRVEREKFITFEKDFDVRDQKGPYLVVAAISPLASLPARPAKAIAPRQADKSTSARLYAETHAGSR
jgi:hypothetical protein